MQIHIRMKNRTRKKRRVTKIEGAKRSSKRAVAARTRKPGKNQTISVTVPAWILAIMEEEREVKGNSRSEVLRDWLFEHAKSQYADRIPV